MGAVGRADLDESGRRRHAQRPVRHHRRQLQRSRDSHERRLPRVRPRFREDPLVPSDDAGGRLEHRVPPGRQGQLSRFGRPRFRFRFSADSGDAFERPSRARGRAEIRRRPRHRSRQAGRSPLAKTRRQRWNQWRRSMGLCRRPDERLRGAFRPWPFLGSQEPSDRTRSESWRRHVRSPPREWRASLAHAAAAVRYEKTLQPRSIGRGQRHSWRGVLGIDRRASASVLHHQWSHRVGL